MNHNEYRDVEDFLIDNTFQAYCAEENEQCISYWEKYIATHPEQAETIARAKRLFHILAGHKKPVNKQLEAMKQTIAEQESAPRTFRPNFMNILKVAAVLVALGFGYLWFSRAPLTEQPIREMSANVTRYETKLGEKKMFELKDGTKVTLNSGSRLEVEGAFNQEDRHVNLIGEAFFEVAKNKDKPFVLHTNDFDIRVLGTTFNVKSYPEEMRSEALLVEGLIEMKSKGENENSIIVKPNQKVTIYRQVTAVKPKADVIKKTVPKAAVKEIAIQDVAEKVGEDLVADIAWKENRLVLVDQDFSSLKPTLERWYDVDITIEGAALQDYRFTATFSRENIEQVLIALQKVQPFKYEIHGRKITIKEK